LLCALHQSFLPGEELSHSLLRVLLSFKDLAILLIKDFLGVGVRLYKLCGFVGVPLIGFGFVLIWQGLMSENHAHLLWLLLRVLYNMLQSLVFLRACHAWLRTCASVTEDIRVDLLLILVNYARSQHLVAELEILTKQNFRRCFWQVRFAKDYR
jgi:hypothetical protein